MSKLDFSKPELLQTRNGCEVRIYATDAGGDYPVHGATHDGHRWGLMTWTLDGVSHTGMGPSSSDLIAKPQRVAGWVNVYYPSRPGFAVGDLVHKTIADAQNAALSTCIGQIYIDAEVQS